MVLLGVAALAHFAYWFFQPEYQGDLFLFVPLAVIFGYGILRNLYIWYHYLAIQIPKITGDPANLTVDVFTTYFPGEPREMVEKTLVAIQKISYPHTTYLCDEANDAYLQKKCLELGIHHVTRTNRIDAKAGNINNALKQATGDICLILDPDHVPEPDILNAIIPYFNKPEVGFVQVVQSYSNKRKTLVSIGAAEQTFQFYGPMMMSMQSYGTVNAIGANCTFRRAALDSIDGHAPGLAEDMHTAMRLHARGWKSIYVPKVLARGLAPETLTGFFKQQLKWSRGTFELLFRVYPKLFREFTLRQKIHYGLLPLHFLVGLIYLLSFSIPILSLLFSSTPWTGNILFFLIILLPVTLSNILIRAYIQKWVIESDERGFHLMGGILQITTWWIYLLGFVYAIFNKEVPYLPTPKKESQNTNLKIIVPNILMGLLSLMVIPYGLHRDFTPFSVMMAGFALLNALFMFFGVYLATRTTNQNQILRTHLKKGFLSFLFRIKRGYRKLSRGIFIIARKFALPILLAFSVFTVFALLKFQSLQWSSPSPDYGKLVNGVLYYGIFDPSGDNGLTDLTKPGLWDQTAASNFDLISLYLAWGNEDSSRAADTQIREILGRGSWPLLTWEPWTNSFKAADSIPDLAANKKVFQHIVNGDFDSYIDETALMLKGYDKPVFLRFAHEFDNPAYPWSESGDNTPEEFVQAWRYVHKRFADHEAKNIIWVWNPFTIDHLKDYFPGEAYIDWVGVTALNYDRLNKDGESVSFQELYKPFHEALFWLTDLPVMLAEFGSLSIRDNGVNWLEKAIDDIPDDFPEIKAIVFFNSSWDLRIPEGSYFDGKRLDWRMPLDLISSFSSKLSSETSGFKNLDNLSSDTIRDNVKIPLPKQLFRGVNYRKGENWYQSNYVLTRKNIQQDFRLMKKAGINTIRFQGPSFYDHNILSQAKTYHLQAVYSFHLPALDFIGDPGALTALENRIIKTIKSNKNRNSILAWGFENSLWHTLRQIYPRPLLDRQREAALSWLRNLLERIKSTDPNRPVIMDLGADFDTADLIDQIADLNLRVDAISLVSDRTEYLNEIRSRAAKSGLQHILIDMKPDNLSENFNEHVFIRSWQDQWKVNHLDFNGLLDHKGRMRRAFYKVAKQWGELPEKTTEGAIGIQHAAKVVIKGAKSTFQAMRYEKGKWHIPGEQDKNAYEWYLIKTDFFGNPIALRELGNGTSISLKIPAKHDLYKIMLSYQPLESEKPVISTITTLNLPLYNTN